MPSATIVILLYILENAIACLAKILENGMVEILTFFDTPNVRIHLLPWSKPKGRSGMAVR